MPLPSLQTHVTSMFEATRSPSRAFSCLLLSITLALSGPATTALAKSGEKTEVHPLTLVHSSQPPRGTGLIVGGAAVVTLIGLPSLGIGLLFNGVRKASNSFDSDFPDDSDFPEDSSFEESEEQLDKTFRGVVAYFVVSGLLGIAGGGTMIGFGVRRYSRFRQWKAVNQEFLTRHRVTPVFSATPRATATYGFAARF